METAVIDLAPQNNENLFLDWRENIGEEYTEYSIFWLVQKVYANDRDSIRNTYLFSSMI